MTYIKNIIYQPKRKIQYIFIITKEKYLKKIYTKTDTKNNKNISKKKLKNRRKNNKYPSLYNIKH